MSKALTIPRLATRSLLHYRAAHIATIAAITVATAVLAGALIVGDSMRGSLRASALDGLGRVVAAVESPRLIDAALVERIVATQEDRYVAAPLLALPGAAVAADTGRRCSGAYIIGVEPGFQAAFPDQAEWLTHWNEPRVAVINRVAADELRASVGDDILVHVERVGAVSGESLMGRKDERAAGLRVRIAAILENRGPGRFALTPQTTSAPIVYVRLDTLQRAIEQPAKINTILYCATDDQEHLLEQHKSLRVITAVAGSDLRAVLRPGDIGVHTRLDAARRQLTIESDSLLIDPVTAVAVEQAVAAIDQQPVRVLANLANRIALANPRDQAPAREGIPYSTVAGTDQLDRLRDAGGQPLKLATDEIALNSWAAAQLGAELGDRVQLTYYVSGPLATLREEQAQLTLAAIVPLEGAAADPGWVPTYPGISDSDEMSDWDPPFPVDLRRVRPADEAYWDDHRATPKAFVSLATAQRLWTSDQPHLGQLTAIRIYPNDRNADLAALQKKLEAELQQSLIRHNLAPAVAPVRQNAISASRGSTEFGGLFIGFSMFLIASAALLTALLTRLAVERRARELGLLLATGFAPRAARSLFLLEFVGLGIVGGILGLPLAAGYAALMLCGLQTWWRDAVTITDLRLYVMPISIGAGLAISILLSVAAAWWAIRGLTRVPPRALLAGQRADSLDGRAAGGVRRRIGTATITAIVAAVGAFALLVAASWIGASGAFFGAAALLLVAGLSTLRALLQPNRRQTLATPSRSLLRLGLQGARRNPARTLLIAGLVSSAAFLVCAVGAFRLPEVADIDNPRGGAGGYALFAESAVPVLHDLASEAGQEALNLRPSTRTALAGSAIQPLRLRPGDEASCLGLYQPTEPRILGAPQAFIERGGFAFGGVDWSVAPSSPRENPWTLLNATLPDGAIPVIGDEAAVRWQLKRGLGQTLQMPDDRGQTITLRFVALLRGSGLQSELMISEAAFRNVFPARDGYRAFLIQAPAAQREAIATGLEADLAEYALDATTMQSRIAAFNGVQNTYLLTFQSLGGLGLLLGTFGLAALLARTVLERRRELGLLAAVGFALSDLRKLLLAENVGVALIGIVLGVAAALLAVAPQWLVAAGGVPWLTILGLLVLVPVLTWAVGAVVVGQALRGSLTAAIRSE